MSAIVVAWCCLWPGSAQLQESVAEQGRPPTPGLRKIGPGPVGPPHRLTGGAPSPRGDMVYVPSGAFWRGSDKGRPSEKPKRSIVLDSFWIDRNEVTVEDYQKCVAVGVCAVPEVGSDFNWSQPSRKKHPINGVSWHDATTYCTWVGKRLPTEAQWEKAARGTDDRPYVWGAATPTCEYAVMSVGGYGCGRRSTWDVGSKPKGKSFYGANDMGGNLWEWVADWYQEDYYATSPARNPQGPLKGSQRSLRGSSWDDTSLDAMRVTYRGSNSPTERFRFVGFRCAYSNKP